MNSTDIPLRSAGLIAAAASAFVFLVAIVVGLVRSSGGDRMRIGARRPLPKGQDGAAPSMLSGVRPCLRILGLASLSMLSAPVHTRAQDEVPTRLPREVALYRIQSESMAPVLRAGDTILVDVGAPVRPERGDIIAYRRGDDALYVHRVVGLPGDRVQYVDGRLRLDGAEVPRERLGQAPDLGGPGGNAGGMLYRQRVGDRSFEIIELSDQEWIDNTPPIELAEDEIMVLGDNRDNAMDSRISRVGPISLDQMVGIARFRVWPSDRSGPIYEAAR